MEAALWNLEDKLKLSTKQALFLLLFAASSVFGLCVVMTATFLRRLKSRKKPPQPPPDGGGSEWPPSQEPTCGWAAIKRVLMSSVRWSRPRKWPGETACGGSWRENSPLPLLEKRREFVHHDEVGWQSHNSDSPVWQRPILMGEKCELPRFSGLILYDENGHLLCDVARKENSCNMTITQEKTASAVRKTLRDLL